MSQHKMTAVPREMRADFVYIATGNGMAGYGIQSGDDVYIRQQDTADNGDIVAILVDGAVFLRRCWPSVFISWNQKPISWERRQPHTGK